METEIIAVSIFVLFVADEVVTRICESSDFRCDTDCRIFSSDTHYMKDPCDVLSSQHEKLGMKKDNFRIFWSNYSISDNR